jgi:hypothetical protein
MMACGMAAAGNRKPTHPVFAVTRAGIRGEASTTIVSRPGQ